MSLAGALMMTAVPAAAIGDSGRFVDDDGLPAEQALEWLADRDVIHGCDPPANKRVCPESVLTRAEAAKILVLLGRQAGVLDQVRPGGVDHFHDDSEVWDGAAEQYIDHLADVRVVHGCDPPVNEAFCPQEALRRGQITKMAVATFRLDAPDSYPDPWEDTDGQFYQESARVAAYHGLFDPSAGIFAGSTPITRAEFAQVAVRILEPGLCADDPFKAGRVAALEESHPGVSFTAYAYDVDTGCAYSFNPEYRQQTASVFKVMVMAGTLLEAQADGRSPTATEMDLLADMITESANEPVRELWRSFGGAPWFLEQAEAFGLDETDVLGDYQQVWGHTTTSAHDQADLLRQVLLGHGGPLGGSGRQVAFDLMTSVVESQAWGVSAGVPDGWEVAQKNGFAGQTTNSVGVVYDALGEPKYVVAVLTFGWGEWSAGVDSVELIGRWVAGSLAG